MSYCILFMSSHGDVTGSNESVVMQQPVVNIDRYVILVCNPLYVRVWYVHLCVLKQELMSQRRSMKLGAITIQIVSHHLK